MTQNQPRPESQNGGVGLGEVMGKDEEEWWKGEMEEEGDAQQEPISAAGARDEEVPEKKIGEEEDADGEFITCSKVVKSARYGCVSGASAQEESGTAVEGGGRWLRANEGLSPEIRLADRLTPCVEHRRTRPRLTPEDCESDAPVDHG
ncbi:hypothetical protein NUW54_g14669 [Trametes sanguinea]|uniref:Uncharacterized protein n=1 Tax=Trametes sanguinea TaxID=158606 RepID=A0ACC1MBC4_9APHY|nr:hypothetical protein NUW54_g14669 [Trametes sanguinea]